MSEQKLSTYPAQAKERVEAFKASLLEESDRGLILVGGAFLEEELEELLRAYFALERNSLTPTLNTAKEIEKTVNSLFSFHGGALGTLTAKLNLTYAIGLLEEYEFRGLDSFVKLCNKFAHKIESKNLQSPQVADLVRNFLGTKKIERKAVADRVSNLAAQIITRVLILNQAGLTSGEKKTYLGFARGDPYGLKRRA